MAMINSLPNPMSHLTAADIKRFADGLEAQRHLMRRFIPLHEWVRPRRQLAFVPEGFIDRYIAPVTRPPIDEIHSKGNP